MATAKKYFVYRISKITGRKEWKSRKNLDYWVGEKLKPYCWQYTKQGANGIIKWQTERHGWNFEYGMEEVTEA
jgi:hypothetical protein